MSIQLQEQLSEEALGRRTTTHSELSHFSIADKILPGGALGGYAIDPSQRFIAVEGNGARIRDESGNWYIDFVMGAGAMIVGHADPAVTTAIQKQAERGTHFFSILNDVVLDLVAELQNAIPCAEAVTFSSTGSEATFYAMRMARAFTGKNKILKFEGAYHGNHDYSLISSAPQTKSNYPAGRADTGGIPEPVADQMLVAPFNDLEAVRTIIASHKKEMAAIIVEPVQRILFPRPGFLEGLRKVADENGILLIFDEVVTGFRLAYGGAQERFGVIPDLAAFGKVVGGGLALGAVAGKREIMELSDPARKGTANSAYINGTLHGNPLASAAGLATLRRLQEPGFYTKLNDYVSNLRAALTSRLTKHGTPAIITGGGSLWHIHFSDRQPKNHADVMDSDVRRLRAFDRSLISSGIFVLPGVRRLVSSAHGQAEFDSTVDAFDRVCSEFR